MRDWVVPAPLKQPAPRKVKMRGGPMFALILSVMALCTPFIIFYWVAIVPSHQDKMLETRGTDIYGRLVELQASGGAGRAHHAPRADYIYAPAELAGKPDHIVRGWSIISEEEYRTLRVGGVVLLVYDPLRPEEALLKSTVDARRLRKGPRLDALFVLVVVLPMVLLSPILYVPWMIYRQRRLLQWGKAARATIAGESESVYKGTSTSTVSYAFHDESGARWTGQTTFSLGQLGDPRPNADLLDPPTVVYDPRNGARNMLYPGSVWTLVE